MTRILVTMSIIAVSVLTATFQSEGQSTIPAKDALLSKDAATTVGRLLSLSQQEFSLPPGIVPRNFLARSAQIQVGFLDLLKILNAQVDDDMARKVATSSTEGIERNLLAMARDYGRHPDRYAQLREIYGRPRGTPEEMARHKERQARYYVETYRPLWEFLLLATPTYDGRFDRTTFFQAIGTIRNDASVPVLFWLYERANRDAEDMERRNSDFRGLDEQLLVLQTLGRFCDSAALHAMLRCVAMSEAVPPPLPKKAGFTMKEWAMRLLRDQENYGNGKQWRVVIEKALQEKEKLSDADRTFLEDVLKVPAGK